MYFPQCCSFLQSHPVIFKSIIPTDKVKTHTEYQLLKRQPAVIIPCTLSDKIQRICFERKHGVLTKQNILQIYIGYKQGLILCGPRARQPSADGAAQIYETDSWARAKCLLNEGGVFRGQSYCWLCSAPRSHGLWSDTQHTWHLHARTLCHVS